MRKSTIKNLLAGLCFALLAPMSAFADIVINETFFPDPNFRAHLLELDADLFEWDKVGYGVITDDKIAWITGIEVRNMNISTLEGIRYFTALEELWCEENLLTSLDVSNNTEFKELNFNFKHLTSLDVSKNTALTDLQCNNNQLTSLNVSNNILLAYLHCSSNQLTSLDVSKNKSLYRLYCYDNNIKGTNMDALISSLPNRSESNYSLAGIIYIYDSTSETEGNVCTKSQVAAIKAKRWIPYYYNGTSWVVYEGADETTGIDATEVGNGSEIGANAVAYYLNGNRVEGWQNKKGIYIVNGKKVVVK